MAYSLCWCAEWVSGWHWYKGIIVPCSLVHRPPVSNSFALPVKHRYCQPSLGLLATVSYTVVSLHPRSTTAVVYIPGWFRLSSKLTDLLFQVWMTLIDCIVICRLREEFTEKLKKKTSLVLKKRWNLKLTSECHPLLLAESLGKEAKRQVPPQELRHSGGAAGT